jgi:ketosteroid isomerase-like protein
MCRATISTGRDYPAPVAARSNLDVVKDGFKALSTGDVEALMPFIHRDFEMTTTADVASEPDTYMGPEGVRRYFDSFYDAMDEVRFEPGEFQEVGGRVIAQSTLIARGRATGIEVEQEVVLVWSLRDDQVIRIDVYATLDEALEAAQG